MITCPVDKVLAAAIAAQQVVVVLGHYLRQKSKKEDGDLIGRQLLA